MYFECVKHEVKHVESAAEAAKLAKSGTIPSYIALCWKSSNGTFLAVSDTHVDDVAFGQTAIIKQEEDFFIQKESITVAWINGVKRVESCFNSSETSSTNRKVSLIIGEPTDQVAWFTCGCCGESFKDSVKKQLEFDQDEGFGICKQHEKYYS